MACNLTLGRKEPCKDVVGGIKKIYLINFEPLTLTEVSGEVTDIADAAGTADVDAVVYEVRHASSLTSNINSSRETGTTFFESTLELTFKKLSQEDNAELAIMAHGRPHIVVVDNNDNRMIVGHEYGCEVTGGTLVTGNAMGDLSGYTLTFTAQERTLPKFMDNALTEATFEALLGTVTEGTNS